MAGDLAGWLPECSAAPWEKWRPPERDRRISCAQREMSYPNTVRAEAEPKDDRDFTAARPVEGGEVFSRTAIGPRLKARVVQFTPEQCALRDRVAPRQTPARRTLRCRSCVAAVKIACRGRRR